MDICDSIAAESVSQPGELPLTDGQRREILRRAGAHRRNPGEAIPLDEAHDRIERSLK